MIITLFPLAKLMRISRVEVCKKNLGESLQVLVLYLQPPDLSMATCRSQSQGESWKIHLK